MDISLLKALACESRLQILEYLKHPSHHFPPVEGFDLDVDGVWNKLIARKLEITQESVTLHMDWLVETGLVTRRKVGTRCFYKRDEQAITRAIKALSHALSG